MGLLASFIDLYNTKLSYKYFLKLSDGDYIFECVNLERFLLATWITDIRISPFLQQRKECKNLESLYREEILNYFQQERTESGLEYLKTAVEKGYVHVEATYVYSIILLCLGDDGENFKSKLHGIKTTHFLKAKIETV